MLKLNAQKIITGLLIAMSAFAASAAWLPPANPDPHAIYLQIAEDYRAKRNEIALEKTVWFHDNALFLDSSLRGVRLSFALVDWKKLADVYPPAMAAYVDTRNRAEGKAGDAKNTSAERMQAFTDAIAMNGYLRIEQRNVALFKSFVQSNPADAKQAYRRAERSLIKTKSYALCNSYLDPQNDYTTRANRYREDMARAAKNSKKANADDFDTRFFASDIANLIALLVVNNRMAEAIDIATKVNAEFKNAKVKQKVDAALKGEFPVEAYDSNVAFSIMRFFESLFRF